MENEKLINILDELNKLVKEKIDIYEIAKIITHYFIEQYNSEMCEINIEGVDGYFSRIDFALNENGIIKHDDTYIEKLFGSKQTLSTGTFAKHILDNGETYVWTCQDNFGFKDFINTITIPIEKTIAKKYLKSIPSGNINNFIVIPILIPYIKNNTDNFKLRGCFHLYNILEGKHDKLIIEKVVAEIFQVFDYLSIYLFTAKYYSKAVDEININKKIEELRKNSKNLDTALENVVKLFSDYLQSPLSAVWMYNEVDSLLYLHSFHIDPMRLTNQNLDTSLLKNNIESKVKKILKVKNSYIGQLITNFEIKYLRTNNVLDNNNNYQWKDILKDINGSKLIAFPIRSDTKTLAIITLHPNLDDINFEKIPIDYYLSFCEQVALTLRFFIENRFSENIQQLSNKLSNLITTKEILSYNELIYKINEIIGAEASSVFEAKGGDIHERGIYLKATTDKRPEIKKLINKKIYELDRNTITGYVALTGKQITVFDMEKAYEIIPELNLKNKIFVEDTIRPQTSYIAVPIPSGIKITDDSDSKILIIRCINKKQDSSEYLTPFFSDADSHSLLYIGIILESFRRVYEILEDRNALIDLIIHEVKNPLATIRGKIDNLKKYVYPRHKFNLMLDDIDTQAILLRNNLLNTDLLSSLLKEENIEPKREKLKLRNDIVDQVINWLRCELEDCNISPKDIKTINIDDNIIVNADGSHILQVFSNIIINALKYKKPEDLPRIEIQAQIRNNNLEILIKDWGIGIDNTISASIFKKGFRSSYAKEKRIPGKGFGLWLCYELLKQNKLQICIENPSLPTIFKIIVPPEYYYITKKTRGI